MIVVEDRRKLAMQLKHPERVLQVIRGSKLVDVDGVSFVIVKHGMDEVRVLRNMGIQAPSPIITTTGRADSNRS
jgi:hypothetical protein